VTPLAAFLNTPQVEKEKEALRMELNKAKQQIKEADTAIGSQKAEIEKLNHIINEADQERIRQKKEYDIVVNERDILGTQVCVYVCVCVCVNVCVLC